MSAPKRLLPLILLAAAAVLPFVGTLRYDLVWDDHYLVTHVEMLSRTGGLPAVLSAPFFPHPGVPNEYYRPVVYLSIWLDGLLGSGSAGWFHITNVLFHLVCSLLCAVLLRRLVRDDLPVFAGSLLFALHPTHVESVAFVSGRTDLLAAMFVFLAVLGWAASRDPDRPARTRLAFLVASAISFLAASLSKENAILLPALLVLWDLWVPKARLSPGTGWWSRNGPWIGLYVLGLVVIFLLRHAALGVPSGDMAPVENRGLLLLDDPAFALMGLLRMLRMLIFPWPHNALYTRQHLDPDAITVVSAIAVCALFALAIARAPDRINRISGVWVAIFLAPALLVPSYGIVVIAERYLYLPSFGFCLVVSRLLLDLCRTGPRRRAAASAILAVGALVLGIASFSRACVWRNDVTLGADLVRTSPASALAHDRLGQGLLAEGRYREAFESFDQAVSLEPLDPAYHNDIGIALRRLNMPALAAEAFRQSLLLDPGAVGTRLNLAYVCITLRDTACIEEQRMALAALDPDAREELERVLAQWQR